MPIRYTIDTDAHLVTLLSDETPTFVAFQSVMQSILTDPAFQPGFDFLADRRAVAAAPTTPQVRGMVELLATLKEWLGEGRWAVVVSRLSSFGMARMESTLLDVWGIDLAVFHDMNAARSWLAQQPLHSD